MKTTKIIALSIGITTLATVAAVSGPSVTIQVGVPAPPPVVVAPAPAVTVEVGVPDTYVWDGYEYVGVVGTDYFYLGPGDVWLPLDAPRMARWHDWERGHADWRFNAIRNERYRHDAHGHEAPMRDSRPMEGHDMDHVDHGHDKDHDHDH
jgi:hypothetical protein